MNKVITILLLFAALFLTAKVVLAAEIHDAAFEGKLEKVKEILKKDPKAVNAKTEDSGLTPLYLAIYKKHEKVANYLIQNGADVKTKDEFGTTPLHVAAEAGLLSTTKLLLEKGAEVNAKDKDDITSYRIAKEMKHKEIAELLEKHGGKDLKKDDVKEEDTKKEDVKKDK